MLLEKPRLPIREIVLFGWLPSRLKALVYRLKGYEIGRGARFGFGSVVIGRDVKIGDRVQFGLFTVLRGTVLRIGSHVQIGSTTIIDTPHVEIGDGTRINEQVFIGGLQFPDSKLIIGRNCQIMQMTFINPTRSVTIGDDTGVGGHSLIFGHTSWLSRFDGYPVEFDSVEIGNSVSISWRVFLLPGTRVGDGAVVGANSLVKGQIPERCLAVGFPARVVNQKLPREMSIDEKRHLLHHIVTEMLGYFENSGLTCRRRESMVEVIDCRSRRWRRRCKVWRLVVDDGMHLQQAERDTDVFLSLPGICTEIRRDLERSRVMWIDIENKERSDSGNDLGEEVALYLRRYGVRFLRDRSEKLSDQSLQKCAAL